VQAQWLGPCIAVLVMESLYLLLLVPLEYASVLCSGSISPVVFVGLSLVGGFWELRFECRGLFSSNYANICTAMGLASIVVRRLRC
jgi:hypothetical protein